MGCKGQYSPHQQPWQSIVIAPQVVSLTSGQGTPFKAGAEVHPTFLDPKDAENITIPICMLASKDEDAETVKAFVANLKGEKYFETFSDQVHGWMGAR